MEGEVRFENEYEICEVKCPDGHSYESNKWIRGLVPALCFKCHGGDWVLNGIMQSLKGKYERILDDQLVLLAEKYPEMHSPLSVQYRVTCERGHIFNRELGELIEGRWCIECLEKDVDWREMIKKIAKKEKIVLFSPIPSNILESFNVIDDENCKIRIPNCVEFIYGTYYNSSETIEIQLTQRVPLDISSEIITAGLDSYKPQEIKCPKGHSFTTAPFMLNGKKWCPNDDCNGPNKSVDAILKNLGGSAMNFDGSIAKSLFPTIISYVFKCSEGHIVGLDYKRILNGIWCKQCLDDLFPDVASCKALARAFDGKYNRSGGYVCSSGSRISKHTYEVLRGRECLHEKCKDKFKTFEIDKTIIEKQRANIKRRFNLLEEVRKLDKDLCLTENEIETATNKYNDRPPRQIFLFAKYNTIQKIKRLAETKGGRLIFDEEQFDLDKVLSWSCNKEHSSGLIFEWQDRLIHILEGDWCPICSGRQLDYVESKKSLSIGERAVERYLLNKGWSYISQHSFPNCKNINVLFFDFYVPHLNLSIEFDGKQHFEPVEIFGGEESYESQILKDEIKERYCFDRKIRLIRINRTNYVNEDLDAILGTYPNHCMTINLGDKWTKYENSSIAAANEFYFILKL